MVGGLIIGGDGADSLFGSAARNYLYAQNGPDRIRGGGGDDVIYGGKGKDAMFGQSGNDVINAIDGRRDQKINCGPGSDVARIDRGIDPKPINCEKITPRSH